MLPFGDAAQRRNPWIAALITASLLLCACGSERELAADALQVGYAEVSVPWRVGAKPGQVGTNARPDRDRLLLRALGQLLPLLTPPVDPVAHIEGTTDWVLGMLSERVAATAPGRYSTLFEAGRGVEEPPVMKALVVQRGDTKIAIVRADLYVGHEQIHRRVAELVEAETGIDRDHILLAATHNHSVPHSVSPSPGVWILADAFDPRHFVYVTHAIARAIIDADGALRPASLKTSVREFREVQHNIIGPGVTQVTNPQGVLETVPVGYPYDHFDPDLAALRFDDADSGEPLAFLFVFGMHPESLPTGHGISSGEWPTHVENKVEARTGVPAIWLPGALGDSEPDRGFNHPDHHFMRQGFDSMEVMSEIIADAAEQAFVATGELPGTTTPRLQQAVTDLPGTEGFLLPTSAYLGPRFPMVRILHDATTVRLHVIRLGDALLLGSPAEVTTDLSLNIKSRVDRELGNVYQGYEWPAAPEWVKERVRRNFTADEIDPAQGAPIPIVLSHVNGYMGYIVSAWEYDNRAHYRQEMTAFGPRTADHIASAFVGMARELEGGAPFALPEMPWRALDLAGINEIQGFLAALDAQVIEMSRSLPASDPQRVGTTLAPPPPQAVGGEVVTFSWAGATNDLDPPVVSIERSEGSSWQAVASGPSRDVVVLFAPPDQWTAEWHSATGDIGGTYRFRAEGSYRGTIAGSSAADPLFDPEGKNVPYGVISAEFQLQ